MKIGQMMDSKFLKKEDAEPAKLVTIRAFTQENMAMDGQPVDMAWCMHFQELSKPLVMKSTNLQLCALALGTDETDNWIGKQIVLYNDPNVSFGGKLTGGIRIRARRQPAAPAAPQYVPPIPPGPTPFDGPEDDFTF